MLWCASSLIRKRALLSEGNLKRRIGFEEAQEILRHPYYLDQRVDEPEQYRVIGWVGGRLYSVILEIRNDKSGEYYHLVTLWKVTREEKALYEKTL